MKKACETCPSRPAVDYNGDIALAFAERTTKRLWVVIIILIAALLITNAIWIVQWSQYDYTSYTVEATENGLAGFVGGNGTVNNVQSDGTSTETQGQ